MDLICQWINNSWPASQRKVRLCWAYLALGALSSCSQGGTPAPKIPAALPQEKIHALSEEASEKAEVPIGRHPFFELDPQVDRKKKEANVYITTYRGSQAVYDLNLPTGKLYKDHVRCQQKDIWESYKGDIYLPPFSEGLIPRFLDRSIEPQGVLVFGLAAPEKKERLRSEERLHRVRIVGSLLFQFCSEISCTGKKGWSSRRLLVAVPTDTTASPLGNIVELEELKNRVNWEEAMAYLQNYRGGMRLHQQTYPSYRVTAQNNARLAMNLLVKEARVFLPLAQEKLRKSCETLYDYTWNNLGILLLAPQEVTHKSGSVPESAVEKKEFAQHPEAKLLKENWPGFVEAFKKYHHQFGSRFHTCTRYAPYGDIKESRERFWFMTFIDLFFKLEHLQHVYLCDRKSWAISSNKAQIEECSQEALSSAFDKALARMKNLAGTGRPYYRFIEYDSGYGGSHSRLYSFVYENGKFPQCLQDVGHNRKLLNEGLPSSSIYEPIQIPTELFPSDVSWKGLIRYAKLPSRKVFRDGRTLDEKARGIRPGVPGVSGAPGDNEKSLEKKIETTPKIGN